MALLFFAQGCLLHSASPAGPPKNPSPAPATVDERVLEYGPIGELTSDENMVEVRLDRELVVLGPLGFLDAGDLLQFDPQIPGRAQWLAHQRQRSRIDRADRSALFAGSAQEDTLFLAVGVFLRRGRLQPL